MKPKKNMLVTLGGIAGVAAIIALLIAAAQLWQSSVDSKKQEKIQSTLMSISNQQLSAQQTLIVLQQNPSSPRQIEDLKSTLAALENERLFAQATLTPGSIVQTITTEPTFTPSLVSTNTAIETLAPTSISSPTSRPSPTVQVNTAPGNILKPGDVWRQNGMEMRVTNVSFVPACRENAIFSFDMSIQNKTGGDVVVNISGSDFSISDDLGRSYSEVWWNKGATYQGCYPYSLNDLEVRAMAVAEKLDFAFRIYGNLDSNASRFIVTISKAGRIENAAWEIEIPR